MEFSKPVSPEEGRARADSYQQHLKDLRAVLARETWIIPDHVREITVRLFRALAKDEEGPAKWADVIVNGLDAFSKAEVELRDAGRKDMNVRP